MGDCRLSISLSTQAVPEYHETLIFPRTNSLQSATRPQALTSSPSFIHDAGAQSRPLLVRTASPHQVRVTLDIHHDVLNRGASDKRRALILARRLRLSDHQQYPVAITTVQLPGTTSHERRDLEFPTIAVANAAPAVSSGPRLPSSSGYSLSTRATNLAHRDRPTTARPTHHRAAPQCSRRHGLRVSHTPSSARLRLPTHGLRA